MGIEFGGKHEPPRILTTLGVPLLALTLFGCSSSDTPTPDQPTRPGLELVQNPSKINFASYDFSPVIILPPDYEVYDFTAGYDENRERHSDFGIGRFNEKRPGMYITDQFGGIRDIHMGLDIGAPVGTPVHAFFDGEIYTFGYNPDEGDYGNVIITKHRLDGVDLYALHGHLSADSITGLQVGQFFSAGSVIGFVGDRHENGNWNPHVHFQLSLERPITHDMPGVVSDENRADALQKYLDPRLVLGPIY
ncbi:MAG: peptidoglycan DD-metalloendopeptidase family protein [Deltaproteobacteria bacterium]|nr:peptidoglycan DD-metalloendopeptidase family protein [Deltaproteobacteria bacterium]